MDLNITGEVIDVLDEQTGQGKNGIWRKQQFIIEIPGQYPKQVCVIQWGDNIDKFGVKVGETVTAHIDVQSREFNGKWYTDVKAWKIERPAGGSGSGGPEPTGDEPWPEPPTDVDEDDGLPF